MGTVLVGLALIGSATAREGMWLPEQLEGLQADLTAMDIETPAAELADLSKAPLGAMVDMDSCSGAFVSEDGLIATAYHCIWDHLQHATAEGENLVETGFYAPTREEERWSGPRASVKVTLSIDEVTKEVDAGTKKLTGAARAEKVASNIKQLVRRCESDVGVHCEVVDFDQGTAYRLIKQLELKDLRIVMSPPQSVGYFGGDVDNWQWPRHSGDFAFLRAYAAPDGRPNAYATGNVPYKPDLHLPVALGPKPGDFVMVAGYPAGTYRWLTAAEIQYSADEGYRREIDTYQELLDLMEETAQQYPDVRNVVQPRMLSMNNNKQYLEGNLVAFQRIDAVQQKWDFEKDMAAWIVSDAARQEAYGQVLDKIHALVAEETAHAERNHVASELRRQVVLLQASLRLYKLAKESQKPDRDRDAGYQNRDRIEMLERMDAVDDRFDWRVDMTVMRALLTRALKLPEGSRIPELDRWFEELPHKGTMEQRIEAELKRLYIQNIELTSLDKRRALMDTSPWYLEKSGNPWFALTAALHPFYERMEDVEKARGSAWKKIRPRYMQAVKEFFPSARPRYTKGQIAPGVFYPDANGTLRVTIGKVDGYFPRDGLIAEPRSRLEGISEKVASPDFAAPPEVLAAIRAGAYGPYEDEAIGSVSVNYLSTADTTLGNSGSATVNAKGEWIGVLFDGNYESMATDWLFEERLTRSIHTDSSYVLWYLDAITGADALLTELGFTPGISIDGAATAEE